MRVPLPAAMMTTSTALLPSFMSRSRCLLAAWFRIISLLAVGSAFALLQACSAVKLGYNNAPDLVYWWLDSYADLGEAQSLKAREDLARLHQWHRTSELPKIAELLQKAGGLAQSATTPEQVCSLFADVRARFDATLARAEPANVALAMGLSAAQVGHIEAKFAKSNVEWREDWINGTPAKREARRLKAMVERSEQFYGSLDDRQVGILRDAIAQSDFNPQVSFTERLRRQQDLLQTLRQTSNLAGLAPLSVADATSALRAYLERSVNSPIPAYRAYLDKAIADNCRTVATLHNGASAEQRERAVRRITAYARDARELAAQH